MPPEDWGRRQISLMDLGPELALPVPEGQLVIGRQFTADIDAPKILRPSGTVEPGPWTETKD